MKNLSLINDVVMKEGRNPPIMFQNPDIRKMLRLVKATKNDIFYDLGSGWGQNVIIASTEFKVKRAMGIEDANTRYKKSKKRLLNWKLSEDKANIIKGDFEKLFKNKLKGANLREATIVFYGLDTEDVLIDLKKNMRHGCRLVYYYNCLFPEIMPDGCNFPFYFSTYPFRYTKSKMDWLRYVTNKRKSSLPNMKRLTEEELWDELLHDYDVQGDPKMVKYYKKILNGM